MSNIEVPEFVMPKFDMPDLNMLNAIKLNKLMNDVKKMREDYVNHPIIDSISNEEFEHIYKGYKIEVFLNILECALCGSYDLTINYKNQVDTNIRQRVNKRLVKDLEEMKYEVDSSKDGMYMRIKWEDGLSTINNNKSESIARSVKKRRRN